MGNKQTIRVARFTGRGDSIDEFIMGAHDVGWSLFPAYVQLGILKGTWMGHVWGASYTAADFTEVKENSGTIAMSASGLLFTTGNADGNACSTQAVRAPTLAAGKKVVMGARISAGDLTNSALFIGASVTDADYWSTEPTHQAGFFKDKAAASNAVVGRTKDGTTGSNTTLFNMADATLYDFVVEINPGTNVQFRYRAPSTSPTWTVVTKTTNLPAAGQVLRHSMFLENHTSGSGETLTVPFFGMAWEV